MKLTACSYIAVVGDRTTNKMKPGFLSMPSYRCESCTFIGKNRKHLANHVALNHSTRVYRCSLCAFVTRYQANFYRHRRSIHKLNSANVCEMCGQLCDNQDELVAHTSNEHPQFLDVLLRKLEAKRIRYAKYAARVNMGDGENAHATEQVPENNFVPEVVTGDVTDEAHSENGAPEGQREAVGHSRKRPRESSPPASNKKGRTGRRTYTCAECDLVTKWPREFLSHRKDIHGDRIQIHDCPFCEYASKQPQKLQRHCNIVHKEEMDSEYQRRVAKTVPPSASQALATEVRVHIQEKVFKCSSCNFHARSKVHVDEHEKTVHLKRRFYRCQQCGYVCHEKGRYTRHLRFHSLPKIKCQFCNFQTCYKWNMDRHLKYHTSDGEFRCNKCGFMTMSRKSLTAHCLHHHNEVLKDTSASEGENTEQENMDDDDDDRLMIDEDAGEDATLPPPLRMTLKRTGDTAVVETSDGSMRKCRYCPQQVLWPSELKRHEATHFKMNKKHGCPLCHIRFDQLDHLEEHVMLDHQEEPPEKNAGTNSGTTSTPIIIELGKTDDSTARASYSGSTQALDISIKSKQPMHTCQRCGYTTRWISELRKHELVHGNLKPFKCTYCSYTSRWKGDMTRHVFRMHKENTGVDKSPSRDAEQAKSSHVLRFLLSQPKNADHNYDSKGSEASSSKDSGAMAGKYVGKSLEGQCSYQASSGVPRIIQKYKCPQCSFLTRTASRFHVHMIQHLNKRPFMCSACSYRSNWQWDVNKHIKSKSANDPKHKKAEVVVMDETGFKNYAKYKAHLVDVEESSKGDKVLQSMPSPKPSSEVQLIRPDETENIVVTPDILYGDQDYQDDPAGPLPETSGHQQLLCCGHCSFTHPDRKVVIAHLGTHTSVKPYRCRLCSFVSKWYHIVLMHVKHRHNTGPKDIESKVSFVEDGIMFRLKEEEEPAPPPAPPSAEQKNLKCTLCPYRCSKVCHMEFHMKQHVPREGAVFKCKHCPYYANVKKTLSRHMKLHNAEQKPAMETVARTPVKADGKKHSCEHCPYTSDNKTQYLYHKQFHRPNKNAPHKCTHCNYWSTHSHLMAQHQKIHKSADGTLLDGVSYSGGIQATTTIVNGTAHRMFKCRFCPLTNKRRANVKIHERMHTASKGAKFQCVLCSYRCNNTGVLASHMKLHKADNPSLDLNRMKTFCENLNSLPPRPAVAKKSAPESTAAAAQRSELTALKDKLKVAPRKKIFSYFCEKCPAMFKSHTDLDTHKTYHNSAHLYPCHLCDYRARHKPHLHKHLLVHTPEYAERQNGFTLAEIRNQDRSQHVEPEVPATPPPAAADQMLLLEKAETRAFVDAGSQGLGVQLHRCTRCPAAFQKATTLEYHISLHGSPGVYACHFCNYAANSAANVNAHTHLHYRGALKQKQPPKMFRCDKCPASFSKYNRFQSHLTLHGRNERFRCSHCDYSVKFAANLVKHRKLHEVLVPESENTRTKSPTPPAVTSTPQPSEKGAEPSPAASPSDSATVAPAPAAVEEKRIYICSRCPYAFHRRETVVNHLQRHGTSEGMCCTFCDYHSVHMSTLRDHARCHFQPMRHYKPQAYMKCDSLEIWSTASDGTRTLLFRDDGDDNYCPKLDDCDDAGEDDTTPSSPTSSTATPSSSSSSSTVSSSPELHLNNKDLSPSVMAPVKQEVDDVVLASKETLEDLVSSVVVLNDTKEEMPPGCKTQVVNIVVLDGTKQLNEMEEAEVAHSEHKSESETECKEDGESAQDLFNRICNPDAMEYEDMEDEKDVYCEASDEDPDAADDVECETVEEDSADHETLVADADPMLKAVKQEHSEFLDLSEADGFEVCAECKNHKNSVLCSVEQNSQLATTDVLDDSKASAAVTDECLKEVFEMAAASDRSISCNLKKLESGRPGCSSGLNGLHESAGEAVGGHVCIGSGESVLSNSPIHLGLDECSMYNLQPEDNSPCEMQNSDDFPGPGTVQNSSKQNCVPLSPCQNVSVNVHEGSPCVDGEDSGAEGESTQLLGDLTGLCAPNKESNCQEVMEETEVDEIELGEEHSCRGGPEADETDKLQLEADSACIMQDDVVEIEIGSSLPTIKTDSGDDTVVVPQDVFEMQSPTVLHHSTVPEPDHGGRQMGVAVQGAPVDLELFPEHSDKRSPDVDSVTGVLDVAV